MSVILVTTLFYKALILQGEIWCWSLVNRIKLLLHPRENYTQQNEETCIGNSQMLSANDSSMSGTWNTYLWYTEKKYQTAFIIQE